MGIVLNHTIVSVEDKQASATFLSEILGLRPPETVRAVLVRRDRQRRQPRLRRPTWRQPQHYAFLVSEEEFDAIFARVTGRGLPYWADPGHTQPNRINGHGRGLRFRGPIGHNMEVLTRAYGG